MTPSGANLTVPSSANITTSTAVSPNGTSITTPMTVAPNQTTTVIPTTVTPTTASTNPTNPTRIIDDLVTEMQIDEGANKIAGTTIACGSNLMPKLIYAVYKNLDGQYCEGDIWYNLNKELRKTIQH